MNKIKDYILINWDIWTSQSLHVKLSILSFLVGFIIGGTMSFFGCF